MAELTLYHAIPSRGAITRWMMEELGEPYDLHLLDLSKGEQKKPDYLAINPMGKVPALRHGDTVVTEVAAICAYVADEFPEKKLNVPVGDPRRGAYLKWLFFAPGVIEPAVSDRAFPRKEPPRPSAIGYGDFDTTMTVLSQAVSNARPYLLGEHFTAADVVIGSQLQWGMMFNLIPERPEFKTYVAVLNERQAAKRAQAKDAELSNA